MMPGSSGAQAGTTRVHALYSEMYNNGFAAIQFSVSVSNMTTTRMNTT